MTRHLTGAFLLRFHRVDAGVSRRAAIVVGVPRHHRPLLTLLGWIAIRCLFLGFAIILLGGCQTTSGVRSANSISLTDLNGVVRQPLECGEHKATVLIFITTDCPIANGYAPEINRLVFSSSSAGITFCLVHVDPAVTIEQARKHAADFGFTCPVVLDPTHQLVKAVGATVTPEAAIITPKHELVYLGRIDDKYVDFGKKRVEPSQRDLQNALDAIAAGRPVPVARTKAIGCFMPDPATADERQKK